MSLFNTYFKFHGQIAKRTCIENSLRMINNKSRSLRPLDELSCSSISLEHNQFSIPSVGLTSLGINKLARRPAYSKVSLKELSSLLFLSSVAITWDRPYSMHERHLFPVQFGQTLKLNHHI